MWRHVFTIAVDIGMRFVRYDVLVTAVACYLILLSLLPLALVYAAGSIGVGEPLAAVLERFFPEGFSYSSENTSSLRPVVNSVLVLSFIVATARSLFGAKPSVRVPTTLFAILTLLSALGIVLLAIIGRDPRFLLALGLLIPVSVLFWAYVGLGWVHSAIRNTLMNGDVVISVDQSR